MSGANRKPQPTIAIGVGRAGLEAIESLANLVDKEGENKHFHFIGIDSNEADLEEFAPDAAEKIFLPIADDYVSNDPKRYPYLTEDMGISNQGAQRKRPVGRYKLDSNGNPDFASHFLSLYDQIERHFSTLRSEFGQAEILNIYVIHSIGGGTGSGTFPLLNTMLDVVKQTIESRHSVEAYQVGIGVVPEVTFHNQGQSVIPPRGTDIYFPNAYASFNDLDKMINASPEDPLELPVYAEDTSHSRKLERSDIGGVLGSSSQFRLDSPPFDRYYLFGVDEGRIDSASGGGQFEQYAELIDNTIAEGVYAISRYGNENIFRKGAITGTISQAEVRVPVNRLRQYCEKKQQRDELEHRLEEQLPGRIEDKKHELENIQLVRDQPIEIEKLADESVQEFISEEFGQKLGAGRSLLRNATGEDIRDALNTVEERYSNGLLVLPLALEDLEERLTEAATSVEEERAEVVSDMWTDHDMTENDTYGDIDPEESTIAEKSNSLSDYLEEQIDEYKEAVENADTGGLIPNPFSPSEREKMQQWLDYYRGEHSELQAIEEEYESARALQKTLREERKSVNRRLNQLESEIQEEKLDLEEEQRSVRRELEEIRRDIHSLQEELTTGGLGKRLGYLPLVNLDEIDLQMLENELTDLPSFIDMGYIEENTFEEAIERQVEDADASNNSILKRNLDRTEMDEPPELFQLFVLHHESLTQSEYAEHLPDANSLGANDPEGATPQINNPYRVSFLTYLHQGPIESLTTYQRLAEAAESGEFETMLGDTDHRRSFAYMEWYPPEIRNVFEVEEEVTLTVPQPMQPEKLNKSFDSEDQKETYIVSNALASYLWEGALSDSYSDEGVAFSGWKDTFENEIDTEIGFKGLQSISPSPREKREWLSGTRSWKELLELYADNLLEQENIKVNWDFPGKEPKTGLEALQDD